MTVNRGLHISPTTDDSGTLPRDARLATGGLLAADGVTPLSTRTGVLYDNGTPVVAGTTGLQLNVRPCRVVSKFSDGNGPTIFTVSATEALTMPAPPGSGSRWDVVYGLQPLITGDGGDGGTSNQPIIGIVSGGASGAPVVPSIPAGAVELSRGIVSSTMTRSNQVAWSTPKWTVANGGLIPDKPRTPLLAGPDGLRLAATTTGTFSITSTWWTPAAGNFLRWTVIGSRCVLDGAAQYTPNGGPAAPAPNAGGLTIRDAPTPRIGSKGVISNQERLTLVELGTDLKFDIQGTTGPTNITWWWFNGFSYEIAV